MLINDQSFQLEVASMDALTARRFFFSDLVTAPALTEGVTVATILGRRSDKQLGRARQRMLYVGHHTLGLTARQLAKLINKTDHHSVTLPLQRYKIEANAIWEKQARANLETIATELYNKELDIKEDQR